MPRLATFPLPIFEMDARACGLTNTHDQLKVECLLGERQSA